MAHQICGRQFVMRCRPLLLYDSTISGIFLVSPLRLKIPASPFVSGLAGIFDFGKVQAAPAASLCRGCFLSTIASEDFTDRHYVRNGDIAVFIQVAQGDFFVRGKRAGRLSGQDFAGRHDVGYGHLSVLIQIAG